MTSIGRAEEPPPPASVPAVLSTRDPSSAMSGGGRAHGAVSVSVITAPAKASATASAAGAAGEAARRAMRRARSTEGVDRDAEQGRRADHGGAPKPVRRVHPEAGGRCAMSGGIMAFKVDGEGPSPSCGRWLRASGTARSSNVDRGRGQHAVSPSGRATAEFTWGRRWIPPRSARSRPRRSSWRGWPARKPRDLQRLRSGAARFRITAYIVAGGRVLSAGAVPTLPLPMTR